MSNHIALLACVCTVSVETMKIVPASMNHRILRLAALLVSLMVTVAFAADSAPRRVENFNRDWRFAKGAQAGAEAIDFNDSAWLLVRLPHDWAISGPYE